MSRCFPYPPPGYEVETVVGLAESIKLQKETEKANIERRKERKREKKKEKSKERKDKEREKDRCGKTHNREDWRKLDFHVHTKSTTIEQLEGSGLTEEHGQPVRVHVGGGTRSDDSSGCTPDSSLKRKKPQPPFNSNQPSNSHPPHGNLLRIKLPLIKPKDQATPRSEQDPCCSQTLGKPNNFATGTPPAQEQPIDAHKRQKSETDPRISSVKAQEKLFRELIVSWTPPVFQAEHPDEDDMDWLFKRKERQPCKQEARRCKPSEGSLPMESANVAGQPRASYLQEVDIYALPYVLPF